MGKNIYKLSSNTRTKSDFHQYVFGGFSTGNSHSHSATAFFIISISIALQFLPGLDAEKLDEYILDYQPLSFDTHHLHSQHQRVRRSADDTLHLDFHAYNRHFNLRLKRDIDVFDPDHKIVGDGGLLEDVDTSFIYTGYDAGKPGSSAHMAIIGGTARGYIHIPGDTTYHIESAQQYFDKPDFHAVIYPESKMDKDPFRHKRGADDNGSCGLDRAKEWMYKISRSSMDDIKERNNRQRRSVESSYHHNGESHESKYFAKSNLEGDFTGDHHRQKRATLGPNNTCFLFLSSDPMMWKYVKKQKFNTVVSNERAKEEILAFFASHVSALKTIFSRTIFQTYNGDLSYSGINFVVQRTRIMTPENQWCESQSATSYCNPNIDVSNFLNLNSMEQHDEFCLAYIFTHRDFTRGTLGLAWVGAREVASGGICEKHKNYLEGNEPVPKSLNTGIVTTVNYGKAVPQRVSQLTFTHEVGHNFGSPHDQGNQCAPYGSKERNAQHGNYIMFASATMGDRPNNDEFSECSKDNITRLLHVVVTGMQGKRNCLKPSKTAFCGNGIKEKGEECDCGYSRDCDDTCCYGRETNEADKQCKLKQGVCSPTAGPCCNNECSFINDETCLPDDDCRRSASCLGNSSECPNPEPKTNGEFCNDNAQMCYNGECVKSVCEHIKWQECFLTSTEGEDGPSREALCYVSCENPITGQCVSSYNLKAVADSANKAFLGLLLKVTKNHPGKTSVVKPEGIQLPAGSPCDNFRGYCDVFHKCRGVDAEGPLARLKNLIFNPETLENIQQWIVSHWWAVLLMAIALIVVMGLFIKVCAVHTPSSNPRKPKHRQLTLPRTLQRRPNRQRQQRGAGPRSIDPSGSSSGGNASSSSGGPSGSGGGGNGRRGGNKPETSSTVLIEQELPPPYSSVMDNYPMEIMAAPSNASSPSAPMIEPVGAPDLSSIPPGGPKRGHGGARTKQPVSQGVAVVKKDKNKKVKGKSAML